MERTPLDFRDENDLRRSLIRRRRRSFDYQPRTSEMETRRQAFDAAAELIVCGRDPESALGNYQEILL